MAAYYRSIGSSLKQRMEEIYAQYGRYLNKVDSFEFPGLSGMDKMSALMQGLRDKPLTEIAGHTIVKVTDYQKPEETGLPASFTSLTASSIAFLTATPYCAASPVSGPLQPITIEIGRAHV